MPEPYGAFGWICAHTPLPQCALFFNNLYRSSPPPLTFLFPSTSDFYKYYEVVDSSARGDPNVDAALRGAGAGLGGKCVIGRVGERGSIGDVALIVIAGLSALLAVGLAAHATKRRAAVGRVEIRTLLLVYALHCILQCVSMSSMLQQGSTALLALASVHVAVVVVFFWVLLANGIIATQIVEDGTLAAIIPTTLVALALFGGTLYVALDTAFSFTSALDFADSEVGSLKAVALFSLTLVWPAIAATLYLILMVYITFKVLHERKPAFIYVGAFILFAIAQVIFFLASEPLCNGSGGKVNSAFLASILNTAALGLLYYAWISITEAEWADYDGYAYGQAY